MNRWKPNEPEVTEFDVERLYEDEWFKTNGVGYEKLDDAAKYMAWRSDDEPEAEFRIVMRVSKSTVVDYMVGGA